MTAVPHWDIVGPAATDADLARAAAAGDRGAFADIYDRYADRLHDFCVGMLRDRDGAADCVQDVFCIAATRLSQLRDPDRLRPWLYAIARSEALRRLRDRRRETTSDDLPETMSDEPGPDALAARTELADLISDAAGGLSDRDRSVLELAYRQGLDGPDLAEALGVSLANANKLVFRLRETIERSIGALLVARRVRQNAARCAELATILEGWDGHFSVLMRKRIARHIESCRVCDQERHRLVSPAALLGAAPVFIPAPGWLRERTLGEIQLASSSIPIEADAAGPVGQPQESGDTPPSRAEAVAVVDAARRRRTRRVMLAVGLLAVIVAASLGLTIAWQHQKNVNIAPADLKETATQPISASGSASQAPSNPVPAPPPAPSASTTVPPPAAEPPAGPTITYEAPPPRALDPIPPVSEPPIDFVPPVPYQPEPRRPSSDLPNDSVPPRNERSQPPPGIAGVPPPGIAGVPPPGIAGGPQGTAEQPKRRVNVPQPKPPPQRRAINSTGSGNSDPPR